MDAHSFLCTECGSTEHDGIVLGASYMLRCRACGEGPVTSYIAIAGGDQSLVEVYVAPHAPEAAERAVAEALGQPEGTVNRAEPFLRGRHMMLRRVIARVASLDVPLLVRWVKEDELVAIDDGWSIPCTACGKPGRYFCGEQVHGVRLSSFASFRCGDCGKAYEEDFGGPLPENLRPHLIARSGLWGIEVVTGPAVLVVKVARAVLGISMAEAAALKQQLPGPILPGTRGEADRLHNAFAAAGVESNVVEMQPGRREATSEFGAALADRTNES